jgi:hypothetical protein
LETRLMYKDMEFEVVEAEEAEHFKTHLIRKRS